MTTPSGGIPPALGRLLARATQPPASLPVASASAEVVETPAPTSTALGQPASPAPTHRTPRSSDPPARRAALLRAVPTLQRSAAHPVAKPDPKTGATPATPPMARMSTVRIPQPPVHRAVIQPVVSDVRVVDAPEPTHASEPARRDVRREPEIARVSAAGPARPGAFGAPPPQQPKPIPDRTTAAPEPQTPPVVIGQITVQVASPAAESDPFAGCRRLADGVTANRGGGW